MLRDILWRKKRYDTETLSTDKVLKKERFYGKNNAENMHKNLVPDPVLILLNNPKQPLHARNSFTNQIFWNRIIKKPYKS